MAACKATVGVTCKAAAVEHMGLDFKASSLEEAVDNQVEVGHTLVVLGHNLVEGERFRTLPQSNRRGQTCGSLECAKQFLDLI